MAKDPALLWYFSDWNSGTALMSRFIKGCYMDLLHAQFNHGRLSLEEIKICLGSDFGTSWPALQKKFKQDEKGLFFNERLEQEKIKRANFVSSRNKNLKPKKGKRNHMNTHMETHMDSHMENENVNENTNDILKGVEGETFEENWKSAFDEIYLDQLRIKYGALDIQTELNHFRFKCDSAPSEYHCRDRDGLRLGFLKQLSGESKKPSKQDGTLKIINDKLKSDALIKQKFAAKTAAGGGNAN